MHNRNTDFLSTDCKRSLTDSLKSSDLCKFQSLKSFPGKYFIHSPKCRLHNTSGASENLSGTASESKRCIKFLIFQIFKMDSCGTDHLCKFYYCDGNIHILKATVMKFLSSAFKFLCGTRHHRYAADIFRVDFFFFCKKGFNDSTKHLLW